MDIVKLILDPQNKHSPTDNFYPFGLRGRDENIMPMDMPHSHLEIELFCMDSGPYKRKYGSYETDYLEDEACLFWGIVPHQLLEVTSPGKGFIAYIPLNIFLRWGLPTDFVQAILGGVSFKISKNDQIRRSINELASYLPPPRALDRSISRAAELIIQGNFLTIVEAAMNQYDGSTPPKALSSKHQLNMVIRMIHFIVDHYQQPIKAKDICDHVGFHETYGRNLFKKVVGITLYDFLLNYRLEWAKNKLIHTDDLIIDVAMDSGFGSMSRFHAAFKEALSMSPNQYRKERRS